MNLGRHKATILKNDVRAAGTGTEFVYLLLENAEGEKIASQIWFSKKSMNIAKAQLRACGFDTHSESLLLLKENPKHLAGKKVDIDVEEEEYRGQSQVKARIVTENNISNKRISQLDGLLKGSEKEEDDIPF